MLLMRKKYLKLLQSVKKTMGVNKVIPTSYYFMFGTT